MNRIYPLVLFCLLVSQSYSQDHLSISLFGGTSQYLGDINKTNPVYKSAPSYGFGVASSKNLRYGMHLMVAHHTLRGHTGDFDDFIYPGISPTAHHFSARLIDITITGEFNFLPYETYNIRKRNFTPFLFAGLGTNYFLSEQENQFPLIIPFGLGIKYNIFERFSVGIQWTAKKTFFDRMDGIVNIGETNNNSLVHNDDWYHNTMVFISFHPFRDKIDCPAYGE